MRSKTNDRKEDCVIRDWTDGAIIHPLKQVTSDMTILVVFAGVGVLVGAIGVAQFIKNRIIG